MGTGSASGHVRLTPAEAVELVRELRALGVTSFAFGDFAADIRPLIEEPPHVPSPKDEDPIARAERMKLDVLGSV